MTRPEPVPMCPVRPGDPCTLCEPGVSGPHDCGLVYLVMQDPDLREELTRIRRESQVPRAGRRAAASRREESEARAAANGQQEVTSW